MLQIYTQKMLLHAIVCLVDALKQVMLCLYLCFSTILYYVRKEMHPRIYASARREVAFLCAMLVLEEKIHPHDATTREAATHSHGRTAMNLVCYTSTREETVFLHTMLALEKKLHVILVAFHYQHENKMFIILWYCRISWTTTEFWIRPDLLSQLPPCLISVIIIFRYDNSPFLRKRMCSFQTL